MGGWEREVNMIIDSVLEYMKLREERLEELRKLYEDRESNYVVYCRVNLLRRINRNLREGRYVILSEMEMIVIGEMLREKGVE